MAVSVKDVAARAGVSVGTVSNVLNRPSKVATATVARVRAAIDELGFVRNGAAHQLRAGSSRSVGLIVLDAGNPFFTEVARGAEERAARDGLNVLIGNSDDDAEREAAYLDLFEEQRVRGILITPAGDVADRLELIAERGVRSVLLDSSSDDRALPSVAVDDVAGGRVAVDHLIDGGRSRIAFVGGPPTIRQVADRLAGARAAAERRGVNVEAIHTPTLTVRDGIELAHTIAARAAGDRPDAVFAANDLVALGLMQALIVEHGVRIPDDIALVGYDDIDFAASSIVALSSVRQPSREIGRRAMDVLLAGGDAELRTVFRPELVVRRSSASGARASANPVEAR